jgi:hypothetical protein
MLKNFMCIPGGESAHDLYHKNSGMKLSASVEVIAMEKSPITNSLKMSPTFNNFVGLLHFKPQNFSNSSIIMIRFLVNKS